MLCATVGGCRTGGTAAPHYCRSFPAASYSECHAFGTIARSAITTSWLEGLLFRTYPPIRLLGRTMILHQRGQESNLHACRVELRCTLPCTVHLDFLCPRRIGARDAIRTRIKAVSRDYALSNTEALPLCYSRQHYRHVFRTCLLIQVLEPCTIACMCFVVTAVAAVSIF